MSAPREEMLAARIDLLESALARRDSEVRDLVAIGVALASERDTGLLLDRILHHARRVTQADAGSLYVVESPGRGEAPVHLRFKLSQNDSVAFRPGEFTVPISTESIAGFVAATRKPLNLPDAYSPPAGAPYRLDRSFDERARYRSRSMLIWPMVSHRDDLIGVIQLINRKSSPGPLRGPADIEDRVVPFDQRSEQLLSALSAQAAVALENAMLYEDIARAFDGFVQASVHAIEQRDPTTSGHSIRVAALSIELARRVDECREGPLAGVGFSDADLQELRYAALLHDFGKVGVREEVLLKAKKLPAGSLELILARFDYVRKAVEAETYRRRLALAEAGGSREEADRLDEECRIRLARIDDALRVIRAANEPTVLAKGTVSEVDEIAGTTFVGPDGVERPLLTPFEVECLRIARGSLTAAEIVEIQSHARHTFEFLSRIPWGRRFHRLPLIAASHHERLDGSGYPAGLPGEHVPVQSRIMAVADVYDALTAADRPYKAAVPPPRALDILRLEAQDRHLDGDLVQLFIDTEAYRAVERLGRD